MHRPVVHGLDVGAVRVEDVSAVIAWVVLALTRCAVVPTTRRDSRLVETVDRLPVGRLESDMEPARRRAVAAHENLVYKVRLTNLDPGGGSIDVNISGPGDFTFAADGSLTINARGNWLFWFFPGNLGMTSGSLLLTSGHTTEVLDAAQTPVSFTPSKNTTDACALLA